MLIHLFIPAPKFRKINGLVEESREAVFYLSTTQRMSCQQNSVCSHGHMKKSPWTRYFKPWSQAIIVYIRVYIYIHVYYIYIYIYIHLIYQWKFQIPESLVVKHQLYFAVQLPIVAEQMTGETPASCFDHRRPVECSRQLNLRSPGDGPPPTGANHLGRCHGRCKPPRLLVGGKRVSVCGTSMIHIPNMNK